MSQNHDQTPDTPKLINITIEATPPTFRHPDIEKQYHKGEYQSRLHAEVTDILRDCQLLEPGEAGAIPLTTEALEHLNCIAIIQNGQIIPVVDMEQVRRQPTTPAQRMSLCAMAARAVLDALIEVLRLWDTPKDDNQQNDEHEKEENEGDDDEGEFCHV